MLPSLINILLISLDIMVSCWCSLFKSFERVCWCFNCFKIVLFCLCVFFFLPNG